MYDFPDDTSDCVTPTPEDKDEVDDATVVNNNNNLNSSTPLRNSNRRCSLPILDSTSRLLLKSSPHHFINSRKLGMDSSSANEDESYWGSDIEEELEAELEAELDSTRVSKRGSFDSFEEEEDEFGEVKDGKDQGTAANSNGNT